ncbi:MAG: T9SS type A sorting domain-containing protein [Bacteroidota bacterium]|nr:T9SS type A sorting domain-containing protein [Bacteroidota bacterium]
MKSILKKCERMGLGKTISVNSIYFFFVIIIFLISFSAPKAQSYSQSGGNVTKTNQAYTASSTDESGVKVTNSGVLTLSNSSVTTSGNSSSLDNSSFQGLNAGILATSGSTINLSDCTVNTTGTGANGVFSYGSGTTVNMTRLTIKCTAQGGHAIMATGGGIMTATDVDMTTAGANSGAIATDRGGGTITVTGGKVIASGQDSPGIYSTGNITVTGADISATGAEAAVIEGANSITLNKTSLTSSKANKWGVMIYQSMSGDAEGARGIFTTTGGTLSNTATTGPLFYITNTTAIITLNNTNVSAASGMLLKAAAGNWGTTGKNGGYANLTANKQKLSGDITVDALSTFTGELKDSSSLTGAINNSNTASSVSLTLDATSKWILTANSNLSILSDGSGIAGSSVTNITGNGFNVYYDASLAANSALGGKTYSLVNGGSLMPKGTSAVDESSSSLPANWSLEQNYPNPFNPSTTISFSMPEPGLAMLKIYDITGKEVAILVNDELAAGNHSYSWNSGSLASGIYIYRISVLSGDKKRVFSQSRKLVLAK